MVATTATAAFFLGKIAALDSGASRKFGGNAPSIIDAQGIKLKSSASGKLQVKVSSQAPSKANETEKGVMDDLETDEEAASSPPSKTFNNQLPDWSMLLVAITTIFLAAEKQWTILDWKPKRPDMLIERFGLGRLVEDGLVFRQNFSIRSYEIGADRTASIETMLNHLQETALNHVKVTGIIGDGFGSTQEMCKKNLIWVVSKMQVLVDRYPAWGDYVQVDTWVAASGKNGMRRDWLFRDLCTGETLMRATSVWAMMNKETRRISKMPDEVRAEIGRYFRDKAPIIDEDSRRFPKLNDETADCIVSGLTPKWWDLDLNHHVNNVKYIKWILESMPLPILANNELAALKLEYRRECGMDSVLQSLTSILGNNGNSESLECQHLLRLEGGDDTVKGLTQWKPKTNNRNASTGQNPAEKAHIAQ